MISLLVAAGLKGGTKNRNEIEVCPGFDYPSLSLVLSLPHIFLTYLTQLGNTSATPTHPSHPSFPTKRSIERLEKS